MAKIGTVACRAELFKFMSVVRANARKNSCFFDSYQIQIQLTPVPNSTLAPTYYLSMSAGGLFMKWKICHMA